VYRIPGRNDLIFKLPKEISANPFARKAISTSSKFFSNYIEITEENIKENVFSNVFLGNFSLGFKYNKMNEIIKYKLDTNYTKINQGLYLSTAYRCFLMAIRPNFMKLDEEFENSLKELPSKPTLWDLPKYKTFLDKYGGFYSTESTYGGRIRHYSFYQQELFDNRTEIFIVNQKISSFHYDLFDISESGIRNRSAIRIDEYYKNTSSINLDFVGGKPEYRNTNPNSLISWDRAIDDVAEFLNGKFSYLSDYVFDDPEKKRYLREIIKTYSNNGQIKIPSFDLVDDLIFSLENYKI